LSAHDWPAEPVEIAAGPIQLRPWEDRLAGELLRAAADPELRGAAMGPFPRTPREAQAWIAERTELWHRGEAMHFAVHQATTAELLGEVALGELHRWPGEARVSFWTAPGARRRGVASAAVGTVTRWGFGALGLQRLRLDHPVADLASCGVALACGFAALGGAPASHRPEDGRSDVDRHVRLADDPPGGV
jgi:RimJ/RimL family protein N-acetyltransferase